MNSSNRAITCHRRWTRGSPTTLAAIIAPERIPSHVTLAEELGGLVTIAHPERWWQAGNSYVSFYSREWDPVVSSGSFGRVRNEKIPAPTPSLTCPDFFSHRSFKSYLIGYTVYVNHWYKRVFVVGIPCGRWRKGHSLPNFFLHRQPSPGHLPPSFMSQASHALLVPMFVTLGYWILVLKG